MSQRSRERRKAKQQQQRRQRTITVLVSVIMVAVVAVALIVIGNQPAEAPGAEEALARYVGIQKSFTAEGFPQIGHPQAPVRITEYSNFSCPSCRVFHEETLPGLLDGIRNNRINFTFVPIAVNLAIPNAEGSARAALCAGQQGLFFEMHDMLFEWQGLYVNQAFVGNRLSAGAEALGLDMNAWNQCLNTESITTVLEDAQIAATSVGSTGTPFVTIGRIDEQPRQVSASVDAVNGAISEILNRADTVIPALDAVGGSAETTPAAEVTPETTPGS